MKTQTIINIVFAVAFVGYVVSQHTGNYFSQSKPNVLSERMKVFPQLNPTFESITCKTLGVVDNDGKVRIMANIFSNGTAGISWYDKDGKQRIEAATLADGLAPRSLDDGTAVVTWFDKDGKRRIRAGTRADGTLILPTEDLTSPKEP